MSYFLLLYGSHESDESVSFDQISPLCFLYFYILRAKVGRMKRIRIEISAAYDFQFSYDSLRFVTVRYDFVTIYSFVTICYDFNPFHPIKFHPYVCSISILYVYSEANARTLLYIEGQYWSHETDGSSNES